MTFSSTSPAPLPATPVLRMRDPGELLAALPYLIGFHPRDSLVVVAFDGPSGRRVGLTQRVDLPPPEHASAVGDALARNVLLTTAAGAAVLVVCGDRPESGAVAYGAAPPRSELVAVVTAALQGCGVAVRMRAWAAGTAAGASWACYDECGCRGALPDTGASPLAATAVAAGVVVLPDRAELERLVAPVAPEVLRRRERLLTRAVDTASRTAGTRSSEESGDGGARAVVDAALADAAEGRLRLDDGRVLALALALADPLVRDATLVRCAAPGAESAEQLWAALARETPDPEAAEPAALLAACALLRGDGALAGIALDRAERAWPGHRLTGLLRAAWQAGMRPEQVRECLRTVPLPPAARARLRRRGRRR
jgi:Domain of unknown function (DUF4192)